MVNTGHWPKRLPELTADQLRIRDEFMRLWHEVLPKRFGVIERFNHGYPAKRCPPGDRLRTIEIGAGLGEHMSYEDLTRQDYHAIELREAMAERLRERFPQCHATVADCQEHLPYPDSHFDRAIAVHVLEHLPNLPAALAEIYRVLKPGGVFHVVIPCEGGLAYTFARNISARRVFERHFHQSYDWLIASEHVNVPREIIQELKTFFIMKNSSYFPLLVPIETANLVIGMTFCPRKEAA